VEATTTQSQSEMKEQSYRWFNHSIIFRAKQKSLARMFFWIVLWTLKAIKIRTLFQRDTSDCKDITVPPVRDISSNVAIYLLVGGSNSDRGSSNSDHVLSYVIRWAQRLALKEHSLIVLNSTVKERFFTAYKERSSFEPSTSGMKSTKP